MQSQLSNGKQDRDECCGNDPQRQRPPAALATLGTAYRGDGLRGQPEAFPGHDLQMLQYGNRASGNGGQAAQHTPDLAGAGHGSLQAPDWPEIALYPFTNHWVGGFPDVEFGVE